MRIASVEPTQRSRDLDLPDRCRTHEHRIHRVGDRRTGRGGEEAVELLSQKQFDLVFMDCQMPVLD
ncbi:MAG TPA: hypothetical protein DC060_14545 [Gemmatimonadetes bacterium]|nr:hypothetical protein [Gemmatimonadota bacterium]HBD99403.1 hypothetical protein [Gemmatimonadota bacterium]HIN50399.1 response regulator [Gemmatimonadota bacterium]